MASRSTKSGKKGGVGGAAHHKKKYTNTKKLRSNPTIQKRAHALKKQLKKATGAQRGTLCEVAVPQEYSKPTNNEIIDLCRRIRDPDDATLTTKIMWSMQKGTKGQEPDSFRRKYGVSANTIYSYLKDDKWKQLAASDEADRDGSGQKPLLGIHTEDVLMCVLTVGHRSGTPYKDQEVMLYAAKIATKWGLVNHVTKEKYTEDADMSSWFRVC
jgi:hypothetical protein